VVLFISPAKGIVVSKDSTKCNIGHIKEHWIDVDDLSTWRILDPNETITLSNEK